MIFTFHPEGAEPQSWEFNPDKMLNAECIEIEKRTGWDFPVWLQRFRAGNVTALHAYLFVMMRRKEHGLKWDDVRFTIAEVDLEPSADELAEIRRTLEDKAAAEGLDDDEQAALDLVVAQGVEPADPKA